jgi:ribose transport system ATP-binding protein
MVPVLEVKGIRKSFVGQPVLRGIDLVLKPGEVLALLGQNGAGKSTLIKIISGVEKADEGEILLNGKSCHFPSPLAARNMGICTVYQELSLVPHLSVTENIFLGCLKTRYGFIKWGEMHGIVRNLMKTLKINIEPHRLVSDLSVAEQQLVEIARALAFRYPVIILDEPTAAITQSEAKQLFSIMHSLREQGVGMIYISHRLDEIHDIADRVTVLRDGQTVFDGPSTTSDSILVSHIVGHQVEKRKSAVRSQGEEVLKVDHLTCFVAGKADFHNISFGLHAGEILGISGVVGCGGLKVGRALFGIHPWTSGQIQLFGVGYHPKSPKEAVKHGIAFTSEDRKIESIIEGMSIRRNISVTILRSITRKGIIQGRLEEKVADGLVERLKIKPLDPLYLADKLSGGNQQKVALAKWLCRGSKLFIVCEPTRGMDVQAREDVYKIVEELAEQGAAILIISSDFQEIVSVCDRVLVMRNGQFVGELKEDNITEEALLGLALGAGDTEESAS